jgi:hypothetical protein
LLSNQEKEEGLSPPICHAGLRAEPTQRHRHEFYLVFDSLRTRLNGLRHVDFLSLWIHCLNLGMPECHNGGVSGGLGRSSGEGSSTVLNSGPN